MTRQRKRNLILAGILLVIVAVGLLAGAWRQRNKIRDAYDLGRAILARGSSRTRDDTVSIIFVHHSTGRAIIHEGNVRELLTEAGYEFWDHDYNDIGLRDPGGSLIGYSYNIPGDNTDPDGLARLFAQPVREWPVNALSGVMQHDVIAFKSCFPVSNIADRDQLESYKRYYLDIRQVADAHPEKMFVALTPPPLVPGSTTPENAARAREFANWLKSDEFLAGRRNLFVFDLFDLLAEGDPAAPDHNMLRAEYRLEDRGDSHPNALANRAIGPLLAQFLSNTIE